MGWLTRAGMQRATGCTRAEIDKLLVLGMPYATTGSGRGSEIRIDRDKALAWLVAHVLGKRPPRHEPPEREPPFGGSVFPLIENPIHRALVAGALICVYGAPRYAEDVALRLGCSEHQAREIGGGTVQGLMEAVEHNMRELGEPVFQDPEPAWVNAEAFRYFLPPKSGAPAALVVEASVGAPEQ